MKSTSDNSPWFVYIAECRDTSLYVGIARDVEKRIAKHNASSVCKYTRSRKPVILRYREKVSDRSCALRREAELKKFDRRQKLALIG